MLGEFPLNVVRADNRIRVPDYYASAIPQLEALKSASGHGGGGGGGGGGRGVVWGFGGGLGGGGGGVVGFLGWGGWGWRGGCGVCCWWVFGCVRLGGGGMGERPGVWCFGLVLREKAAFGGGCVVQFMLVVRWLCVFLVGRWGGVSYRTGGGDPGGVVFGACVVVVSGLWGGRAWRGRGRVGCWGKGGIGDRQRSGGVGC